MAKGNSLLFGRITCQMMESYWTSEEAAIKDSIIAKEMNAAEKFVISATLDKVDWAGATLLKGDLIEEVKKLKQRDKNTTILGSGSVITQLADAGLIDLYQFMIFPLLIPDGTPIFSGTTHNIGLKFVSSKVLKSVTVVLEYEPI
jgi:dihydrofolate reductase